MMRCKWLLTLALTIQSLCERLILKFLGSFEVPRPVKNLLLVYFTIASENIHVLSKYEAMPRNYDLLFQLYVRRCPRLPNELNPKRRRLVTLRVNEKGAQLAI